MPHRALRLTKNQNIVSLPWIARSPDLTQSEHVWNMLGCKVRYHHDVKARLLCGVKGQRSPRMTPEPLLVRCVTDTRPDGGNMSN